MNKKRSIKQDVFDIGASCVLGFEIVLCLFSVIQIGKCLIYHMLSVVVFGYHAYRAGILPDYLLGFGTGCEYSGVYGLKSLPNKIFGLGMDQTKLPLALTRT